MSPDSPRRQRRSASASKFNLSRRVQVAIGAGIVAVLIASFATISFLGHHTASTTPPRVPSAGTKTTTAAKQDQALRVVSTTPDGGSNNAAGDSPVTVSFNLPVAPDELQSHFAVLPSVPGNFSQGQSKQDVVFTPEKSLGNSAAVSVVVMKGLTSSAGYPLQSDYSFKYSTAVASDGVDFLNNNANSRLAGVPSGSTLNLTVSVGQKVPSGVSYRIYKATTSDLLHALRYTSSTDSSGFTSDTYIDDPIDTTQMQLLDTKTGIQDNGSLPLKEGDGVYLVVAASGNTQYGSTWAVFSHLGAFVRQDDRKLVLAGEDLSGGSTGTTFGATLYNLRNSVTSLANQSISSTGEIAVAFPTRVDVVVAKYQGEDTVVPVAAPESNGDLKLVADLSKTAKVFLATDKPGYVKGDTVSFRGVAMWDNDQSYTPAAGAQIAVTPGDASPVNARVGQDGSFSGSFPMPGDAFSSDGTPGTLDIRAYAGDAQGLGVQNSTFDTSVQALPSASMPNSLTVHLDKTGYVTKDTVNVTITGAASDGKPLANQPVTLTVYSAAHQMEPSGLDSFRSRSSWGDQVGQPSAPALDAAGKTTASFSANLAHKNADQEVTVVATVGTGASASTSSHTVVVYQADDEVFLRPSRSVYGRHDTVIVPFDVQSRTGAPISGAQMGWEIDHTDYQGSQAINTVVSSGTLSTDSGGYGLVKTPYTGADGAVTIKVSGTDASGNTFSAEQDATVASDPQQLVSFSGDILSQLDVVTDKIGYQPGDTAHLTVTSPAAQDVFMSVERGRIHQYKWLHLTSGDNTVDLPVTADLAPGFEVTLNHIVNGSYSSEGFPISVNDQGSISKVDITPDKSAYAPGATAHVTIAASGGSLPSILIVSAYDANASAGYLHDQDSIAGAFLTPDKRDTNGSSALSGIGSFGGMCGGGGNSVSAPSGYGKSYLFVTVTPDASGKASIAIPLSSAGHVRLAVFAASPQTFGQAEASLTVG